MAQDILAGRITCPVCKTKTSDQACPGCGEDLSLLREQLSQAIVSYNLGLHLAKRRRKSSREQAKECQHLATALQANLIEPYVVLGKVYAQQKQYPEAIAYWSKALSLDHGHIEAQGCLNTLRKLFGGDEKLRLEASQKDKPVRIGSPVHFTEGHKGTLWRILPNDKKSGFTHIVVLVKRFFREKLIVPREMITAINSNSIRLGLSRRQSLSRMPHYRSDHELINRVPDVLSRYDPIRAIPDMPIAVTATDGVVTLSGNVRSHTIKEIAEELALSVEGVLTVRNSLVADNDLELTVARTLADSKHTRNRIILTRAYLGVIYLDGSVESPEAKKIVEEVVRRVEGVRGVVSRLTIERAFSEEKEGNKR